MLRRLLAHKVPTRYATLHITESAATRLKQICDPDEYLRVSVGGGGRDFEIFSTFGQ